MLDIPVLYLSRYIIRNKNEYYRLIQTVRDADDWQSWLLFILKGVEETAKSTISIINAIQELMVVYKMAIRDKFSFYSHDLINNLFRHPYTKIEFLERDLGVSRQTASTYLEKLSNEGLLKKEKIHRHNFYINQRLYELFLGA